MNQTMITVSVAQFYIILYIQPISLFRESLRTYRYNTLILPPRKILDMRKNHSLKLVKSIKIKLSVLSKEVIICDLKY